MIARPLQCAVCDVLSCAPRVGSTSVTSDMLHYRAQLDADRERQLAERRSNWKNMPDFKKEKKEKKKVRGVGRGRMGRRGGQARVWAHGSQDGVRVHDVMRVRTCD